MSRKGAVCFIAAVITYLVAWLVGPGEYWRITVLKILEPAGMILFIFAAYYSGEALMSEYRMGKGFFAGRRRNARIAVLVVFALSLAASAVILVITKFPIARM